MPKYKNSFVSEPADFLINDEEDKKLGTIRVTPVSVKWKPAGKQKFRTVSLDKFSEWIVANGKESKS